MSHTVSIYGHDIEVADNDDIGPDVHGKPIPVEFTVGEAFQAMIPAHADFATLYQVRMGGTHLPEAQYWLLQPPTSTRASKQMSFAELRPVRFPSYDTSDHMHQFMLFDSVGRVTIASGHVEMAMKRVLVTLRGPDSNLMSPDTPSEWEQLAKALRTFCDGSSDLVTRLAELLDEADEKKLREQRNDVVHGYWWMVSAHEHLINARYYRPKSGIDPAMIFNSPKQFQDFGEKLFTLANDLEKLVVPHWPLAIFSTDPDATVKNKFALREDVPNGAPLKMGDPIGNDDATGVSPRAPMKPIAGRKPKNGNNRGKRKRGGRR